MFKIATLSDKGTVKQDNQDSLVVRQINCQDTQVVMAILCDGMGGLSKGELASGTVIKYFDEWFSDYFLNDVKIVANDMDLGKISCEWLNLLKTVNHKIKCYGEAHQITLGTTFTGVILIDYKGLIMHVGDSRCYLIQPHRLEQLTVDHTIVQEELEQGLMTVEQAKTDKRKHILTQCIGVLDKISPQVSYIAVNNGVYVICSDGFRHQLSEREIVALASYSGEQLQLKLENYVELLKARQERDNMSVIAIEVGTL